MNKGFTLIELLGLIILIMIIFWIVILLTNKTNIECYGTSKGIICNYGKIGE